MWKTMFRLEKMETKAVKNKKTDVEFVVFTSSLMNKIHTLKKISPRQACEQKWGR